ncbi:hypothetical protein RG959_05445 [Domibacillus sp. 8LH]|uniref:hypothetical protein n=1 Tax=Domibacillus sp. 8LH TaxID=3073900 RepID=UPI0031819FEB
MKQYVKLPKIMLILIIAWHRHEYLKYEYLELGCLNKKIRKELEEKKKHHYNKYVEWSLNAGIHPVIR